MPKVNHYPSLINVRISDEMDEQLIEIQIALGRSRSSIIRELVEVYISNVVLPLEEVPNV